jgi:hypothetical protein
MATLYPFTFSASGETTAYLPYNFSGRKVDAQIINLGTNDRPAAPATAWQAAYVAFANSLVTQYYKDPSMALFICYGPMTAEYEPYAKNITATLVAGGFKAFALDLTLPHPMTGCYGHPSAQDNLEIAQKARPQVAAALGW